MREIARHLDQPLWLVSPQSTWRMLRHMDEEGLLQELCLPQCHKSTFLGSVSNIWSWQRNQNPQMCSSGTQEECFVTAIYKELEKPSQGMRHLGVCHSRTSRRASLGLGVSRQDNAKARAIGTLHHDLSHSHTHTK